MKRISLFLSSALVAGLFYTGCVKDRNVGPDFSNTGSVLELRTPVSNIAGLAYFGNAVIGTLPDTTQFYVNLASAYPIDQDIDVTIGVDAARVDAYNADPNNANKYQLLPDSLYTLLKTSGTIKSGQRIDSFQVAFYKDKIDPTINYMLPIAILDGDGVLVSQNQGVIWFHAIGNPLAGFYNQSFYRWNDVPDTTGPPNSTVFENVPVAVNPENATTLFFPESYLDINLLGGVSLSFTNTAGVITDPKVFLNAETTKALADVGFLILNGPILLSYEIKGDASNGYSGTYFRMYLEVLNNTGGNRKLIDLFVKQ